MRMNALSLRVVRWQTPRCRVKVLHRLVLVRRLEAMLPERAQQLGVRNPHDCAHVLSVVRTSEREERTHPPCQLHAQPALPTPRLRRRGPVRALLACCSGVFSTEWAAHTR